MKITTLCYIERGGQYLMLHRVKKQRELRRLRGLLSFPERAGSAATAPDLPPSPICAILAVGGDRMKNTTLCYIERGGKYLMLHRTKKENDLNRDKWVGVGGKFEENESQDECLLREVREETGLTLTDYRCRGVVTFVSDEWEGEYMYLYTATGFAGTLRECDEGTLE